MPLCAQQAGGEPVLPEQLKIQPIESFQRVVKIPGSKSLTNRALLIAALAKGETTLNGVLFADDTERMLESLPQLGVEIEIDRVIHQVKLEGADGCFHAREADLFLGNAGTATRFLTAVCALGASHDHQSRYRIDGIQRMRERPIGQLVDPLRKLGAKIQYEMDEGFPPLMIESAGLDGGELTLGTTLSSQYISALMIAGPLMTQGLQLSFNGPVISWPYVEMTGKVMRAFGADIEMGRQGNPYVIIKPGGYQAREYLVEPDASNASYFLAAAAILPNARCEIRGLGSRSLQGDVRFARVLSEMGAVVSVTEDAIRVEHAGRLKGGDFNFNDIPDMAQTLAVTALFAQGRTAIRDIGNLRVKETDRIEALCNELTKLGGLVMVDGDDMIIENPLPGMIKPAEIETYDDHRMAMSFAIAGVAHPGVTILDPKCVNKTFPDFFDRLEALRH